MIASQKNKDAAGKYESGKERKGPWGQGGNIRIKTDYQKDPKGIDAI